ncbi:MAG: Uncharacterised protein [Prochlorococcus marinus str. MIT 9215]|nr:MAG: Uncharacterised protein [Prochlorococcus marinus str. MIT 9215]
MIRGRSSIQAVDEREHQWAESGRRPQLLIYLHLVLPSLLAVLVPFLFEPV